jgi:hypothetical protein
MLSLSTSGRDVDASVVLGDSQSRARFEEHIRRFQRSSGAPGGTRSANLMKQVLLGDRTLTIRAIIHDVLNYELALYPCWVGKPEAHPVGLDPIVAMTHAYVQSLDEDGGVDADRDGDHPDPAHAGEMFNPTLARALFRHFYAEVPPPPQQDAPAAAAAAATATATASIEAHMAQIEQRYNTATALALPAAGIRMEYENEFEENLFALPPSLTDADLSGNVLLSLNFLDGLEHLIALDVSQNLSNNVDNLFTDLSPLARCCPGLTTLNISGNAELDHESLRSLEGLRALVTLDARFISTESFASFVTLHDHGALRTLRIGGNFCNVSDMDACVPRLTGLTTLELRDQNHDIGDNVMGNVHLRRRADHCALVRGLTTLTSLNLDAQELTDVSGLVGMTNLTDLHLEGNPLQDVSALAALLAHVTTFEGPREVQPLPPVSNEPAFRNGMSDMDFERLARYPYMKPRESLAKGESAAATAATAAVAATSAAVKAATAAVASFAADVENEVEDEKCVICFCEFEEGESVIALPRCLHKFHAACLKEAVLTDKNCPTCRQGILDDRVRRTSRVGKGAGVEASSAAASGSAASGSVAQPPAARQCGSCRREQACVPGARFCMFCGAPFV